MQISISGSLILKSFQVKAIVLHSELFSVENGLLTPTFKAKRAVLRKHFDEKLEDLYKTMDEHRRRAVSVTDAQ